MPDSPVKRVTRSRAKASENTEIVKPAPIKSTRTPAKRKLRSDDDTEAAEAPKPRGRPRKTVVTEAKVDVAPAATSISARPTRGRKAIAEPAEETTSQPEASRATRTKTALGKTAISKPTRIGPKKRVTFQVDIDKENREPEQLDEPRAKKPAKTVSLLKSKPVRRAAGTRTSTRSAKKLAEESKPLSPKKFSQPTVVPDTQPEEKTKPSLTSPAKRPSSTLNTSKHTPTIALDNDPLASEITVSPIKEIPTSLLSSPAKRVPRPGLTSSPTKASPFKIGATSPSKATSDVPAPVFKLSLLRSPAKRSPEKLSFSSSKASPTKGHLSDPFAVPVLCPRQPSPVKDISDKVLFQSSPLKASKQKVGSPTPDAKAVQEVELGLQPEELDKGTIFEEMDAMEEDRENVQLQSGETETAEGGNLKSNLFEEALKRNVSKRESLFKPDPKRRHSIKSFQLSMPGPLYMDESDDELSHDPPSPQSPTTFVSRRDSASQFFAAPATKTEAELGSEFKHRDIISMTPLVFRFGNMRFASPSKKGLGRAKRESILSPIPPPVFYGNEAEEQTLERSPRDAPAPTPSPIQESQFEEAVQTMEDMEATPEPGVRLSLIPELREEESPTEDVDEVQEAMDTSIDEDTGDFSILSDSSKENNMPVDPFILNSPELAIPAVTPKRHVLREFYTVSKVPLKPAADESPIRPPIKRRGSICGPSMSQDHRAGLSRSKTVISYSPEQKTDIFEDICEPITPSKPEAQDATRTPLQSLPQTPMPEIDNSILTGVVAYVDVHTAEGSDASGVFVDLLTQMGARCVKQWNWNGKATAPVTCPSTPAAGFGLGGTEEGIREPVTWTPGCSGQGNGKPGSKIGITHVIFKDGGVRTLEKVREAGGIVSCVSAAWVLDCEREGRWVDESLYAVDTSIVPRGGNRRRKSMEPRALAALDSNTSPTKSEYDLSPVKSKTNLYVPQTPISKEYAEPDNMSPVTPYFLKPEQLVQKTCPPKPSQPLFPANSRLRIENEESVRQRLLNARRKTMQWAPKNSSPLVRATSFTVE